MSADWTALVRSGAELLAKGGHEIGDGHADLAHRVALADRHLLVVERHEVDRDAERRSDLVLTAVSPADRLRLIVRGHERRPDLRPHLARERHKALVLRQRKDGHFVRGEMRTEAEHNARALLVGFLVVRGAEDRVRRPVRTDRRLDDMRNEPLVRDVVEVFEILARELGVATQVVVRAVMDTFEFVPAKWERELDVRRRRGVMRALVIGVIAEAHLFSRDALLDVPREARFLPLVVEARSIGGAREVLHLHLLELARSEDEVARGDLVAERLADLRDPERELLSRRLLDVLEVDEDRLRRFRPEPRDRRGVLDRSDEGLEHQIELPRVRKLALAAVRTGHAGEVELLGAPRGRELFALREIVEPEPLAAVAALDQRVGEVLDVSGRFPDPRVHEDGAIQPDDIVAELDHRPPPGVLDVALELDTERTEVPRRARATVDLARGKHEAAPLCERRDLLGQGGPALRALAELRPEAGAIKKMEVEPAAHRGGVDARVERAKGRLEQVEERRRWDAIGRETIDELGDVPARGDEGEIVAHVGVDGASFGSGQDVELTSARELVGGVRQRLRVPGHAARRSPYALGDDAHFAEMAREEDEDAVRLGEVVRLEDDRLGTVRARCHVASMVRNAAPGESRGAYDRSSVGRTLEAHIAAIDEEIRALLTGADPSLGPFYGMMPS